MYHVSFIVENKQQQVFITPSSILFNVKCLMSTITHIINGWHIECCIILLYCFNACLVTKAQLKPQRFVICILFQYIYTRLQLNL